MILKLTAAAVFLAFASGCVHSPPRLQPGRDTISSSLVWPRPPLAPKIRFFRVVAQPEDLGIEPSFWQRLGEIILGRREEWLIRPTGVAARETVIYVADPGAQVLWVLDISSGQFRSIRDAGATQLVSPVAVALGSSESIYVADSYLGVVLHYDNVGRLTRTIANSSMRRPAGLAYDAAKDRLYVADSATHQIWIFTGQGKPLGTLGARGHGAGQFNFPTHIALDSHGTLYVTDSLGFRVQFFSPDGSFLGQIGRHGDASGDFASPKGVALDSDGHIYVVDALFDAVQIFDRSGEFLLSFGERGINPGQFWLPTGLFIDGHNRIYVADSYNQRIQIFQYLGSGKHG